MSATSKGFLAQAKASPGKTAFLALVTVSALLIWGKTLLKGSPEPDPASIVTDMNARSRERAAAAGHAPEAARRSPAALGPIQSFEAARQRIAAWQEPIRLYLDSADEDLDIIDVVGLAEFSEGAEEPETEEEALLPALTGTARLGGTRYAFFDGRRVQVGDSIGRYKVVAIRNREVELLDTREDLRRTLAMPDPLHRPRE